MWHLILVRMHCTDPHSDIARLNTKVSTGVSPTHDHKLRRVIDVLSGGGDVPCAPPNVHVELADDAAGRGRTDGDVQVDLALCDC